MFVCLHFAEALIGAGFFLRLPTLQRQGIALGENKYKYQNINI
jgi:hypothetical protein